MYDVLDISRYIINYCNKKDYYIHNLKLQKILYFVQAYFFIKTNSPCFRQNIEAWSCGPIVPESYKEFKRFAESMLPEVKTYFVFPKGEEGWNWLIFRSIVFDDGIIDEKDKKLINAVVDKLADYSMVYLNDVAMRQNPWKDAYSEGHGTVIRKRDIKKYFSNN